MKAEQWTGMCVQHIRGNSYLNVEDQIDNKGSLLKNNISMNIRFLKFL